MAGAEDSEPITRPGPGSVVSRLHLTPLADAQFVETLERRAALAADEGVAVAALHRACLAIAVWAVHGLARFRVAFCAGHAAIIAFRPVATARWRAKFEVWRGKF